MDATVSYSTVVPSTNSVSQPIEIILDVGAPQISLQQFKFGEHCGQFTYKDNEDLTAPCSNRWIYWKCYNEHVEFVEQSLDRNLIGNRLLLKFINTPILDQINMFESGNEIIILIATVSSVHRIVLKHPRKLDRSNNVPVGNRHKRLMDTSLPSIFNDINQSNFKEYAFEYVLSDYYTSISHTGIQYPLAACSWITSQSECVFALSNSTSGIYLVSVSSQSSGNHVTTFEFKQVTMIERLFRGFVPNVYRAAADTDTSVVNMQVFSHLQDRFLLALSKDFKIRVWSVNKHECITTLNLLDYFEDLLGNLDSDGSLSTSKQSKQVQSLVSLQRPYIRKCSIPDIPEMHLLAVLVKSANDHQFAIVRFQKSTLTFECETKLFAPEGDLIDFFITPKSIWCLCLNSEGNTDVYFASLSDNSHWERINLNENIVSSVNFKTTFLNVRELFIDEIFKSGKFNIQNIVKAIGIFDRSAEVTSFEENYLIERIINSIELKIRENLETGELSSTDYTKLEHQFWEKFHVYCLQYQNVSSKPLGFLFDPRTSFLGLVRKDDFLVIRCNDDFEKLLFNNQSDAREFLQEQIGEVSFEQSFCKVIYTLRTIQSVLVEDALINFELAFYTGESIEKRVEEIVETYLLEAVDPETNIPIKSYFTNVINDAPQVIEVFKLLFSFLDLGSGSDLDLNSLNGLAATPTNVNLSHLMTSELGVSLLSKCTHQFSRSRFNFCRNLILLQKLLLELNTNQDFAQEKLLKGHIIPMTVCYLQLYYILVWTNETYVQLDQSQVLADENRINMLNLLKLNKHFKPVWSCGEQNANTSQSLMSLFLHNRGLHLSKSAISDKFTQVHTLSRNVCGDILNVFTHSIGNVLWPFNSFSLAEFLLSSGLYTQLVQLSNLMHNLKHQYVYTLQFFKAVAHFQLGEYKISLSLFLSLFEDIWKEPFIYNVLGIPPEDDLNEPQIGSERVYMFFRKLMQFFDDNAPLECKIQLCQQALASLEAYHDDHSEQHIASFLSTLFMTELELEDYDKAYDAITLNTSKEQRKSCLREFILHLYDNQLIDKLISYSFCELEDDFVSIIESKARSSDVSLNVKTDSISFYEVLYKYFAFKNNYRRAAISMYEFYLRLAQEVPGKESLERQERSIGMALNCLHITNKEYAWIIKPALKQLPSVNHFQHMLANDSLDNSFNVRSQNVSKRDADGENIVTNGEDKASLEEAIRRKIEVLGIDEIKGEYELCRARLRILDKDPNANKIASSYLNVGEIVTLLCDNSMFDMAFYLTGKYELPLETIFDALICKYIYYIQNAAAVDGDLKYIQDWFIENDTASLSYISYSKCNLVQKMWLLISEYIKRYEQPNQSFIHKCVAEKLLSSGIDLPSTLRLSYQKRNSAELLLLLMSYDRIEESVHLAVEIINGYLGIGSEYFDVTQVMPNVVIYFPHKHIRCLLKILETEKDEHAQYEQLEKKLLQRMDVFTKLTADVSRLC